LVLRGSTAGFRLKELDEDYQPAEGVTALGVARKRTWPEPKRGLRGRSIVLFEVGNWVFIGNPMFPRAFEQNEFFFELSFSG
jgi:hypothetical protein